MMERGRKAYGEDFFLKQLRWDERILAEDCGNALADKIGRVNRPIAYLERSRYAP